MDGIQATGGGHARHVPDRQAMLKKFDTNGDGKIDDAEKTAGFEKMRGHHRHHGEKAGGQVADSNREASASATPPQYGSDGQAAVQVPDPTAVDVTV